MNMSYVTIEAMLPKAQGSIYKLVRLASLRAAELANNKPNLVNAPSSQKLTSVALDRKSVV